MHRSRCPLVTAGTAPEALSEWSPRRRVLRAGDAGLFEEPHHSSVELVLLNHLWRPNAVQLRRSIGGHDNERHEGQVSLRDGSV
jgi:hypothetical protein